MPHWIIFIEPVFQEIIEPVIRSAGIRQDLARRYVQVFFFYFFKKYFQEAFISQHYISFNKHQVIFRCLCAVVSCLPGQSSVNNPAAVFLRYSSCIVFRKIVRHNELIILIGLLFYGPEQLWKVSPLVQRGNDNGNHMLDIFPINYKTIHISLVTMNYTILDCYTDEAAGLGVPPYLGTYPRYIFGILKSKGYDPKYITIDDLRLNMIYGNKVKEVTGKDKTNIRIYNLTRKDITKILDETDTLIVNLGVHVPGKYLTAVPGTLREITPLLKKLNCKKILTGPGIYGTQLEGGKFFEKGDMSVFDEVKNFGFEFGVFRMQENAIKGAGIIKQIPDYRIIEIETGRGCNIGHCSFCTEPIKNKFLNRKTDEIVEEIKLYYDMGCRYFRLGNSCNPCHNII